MTLKLTAKGTGHCEIKTCCVIESLVDSVGLNESAHGDSTNMIIQKNKGLKQ